MFRRTTLLFSVVLLLIVATALQASSFCVDPKRSRFDIQVSTGGLLGALGHDHIIAAKEMNGCADIDWAQLERSSVTLMFSTAGITVLDPKHLNDRPKVQETMESEVLRVKEFPEILFKSERVRLRQPVAGSRYELMVDGALTIRGQTQKVSIPLTLERIQAAAIPEASVAGRYALRQSAFGIKPISLAGGAVRVKDEIKLEFDLKLRESR